MIKNNDRKMITGRILMVLIKNNLSDFMAVKFLSCQLGTMKKMKRRMFNSMM